MTLPHELEVGEVYVSNRVEFSVPGQSRCRASPQIVEFVRIILSPYALDAQVGFLSQYCSRNSHYDKTNKSGRLGFVCTYSNA